MFSDSGVILSCTRLAMYEPLEVRESAPRMTPPSYETAMMVVPFFWWFVGGLMRSVVVCRRARRRAQSDGGGGGGGRQTGAPLRRGRGVLPPLQEQESYGAF